MLCIITKSVPNVFFEVAGLTSCKSIIWRTPLQRPCQSLDNQGVSNVCKNRAKLAVFAVWGEK